MIDTAIAMSDNPSIMYIIIIAVVVLFFFILISGGSRFGMRPRTREHSRIAQNRGSKAFKIVILLLLLGSIAMVLISYGKILL